MGIENDSWVYLTNYKTYFLFGDKVTFTICGDIWLFHFFNWNIARVGNKVVVLE